MAVATLGVYAAAEATAICHNEGFWAFCFAVFTVGCGVAAVGVAKRLVWARWMALGIGLTGLIDVVVIGQAVGFLPQLLLFSTMPIAVLACLSGKRMADHFEPPKLWKIDNLPLQAVKLATILAVPAIAGLLRYVADNNVWWIDGTDRIVALSCAALFFAGAVATAARKTVGIMLMIAPAFATTGLAIESVSRLGAETTLSWWSSTMVTASLAGFLPAVAASFVAFALLLPAMIRFVNR